MPDPFFESARGISLAEVLLVTAIIGLMAVATAPLERFFVHRLGALRNEAVAAAVLPVAGSLLVADARQAHSVRVESGEQVVFTRPDGVAVRWTGRPGLLERRSDSPAEPIRRFPGLSLRRTNASARLFEAVVAADGAALPVTACLRHVTHTDPLRRETATDADRLRRDTAADADPRSRSAELSSPADPFGGGAP